MTTHIPNLVIHIVNSSNQILEASGVASAFTREPTATVQFVAGNGKIIETDFAAGSADGRLPNGAAVIVDSTNRIIESDGSTGPFRQASIAVRQVGSGALASMVLRVVDSSNVVLDRLFGASLTAPTLVWDDGVTDTTPDFEIQFEVGSVEIGDVVRVHRSADSGFGSPTETDSDPLDGTDVSNLSINFAGGVVADGTWYYRARLMRGAELSPWSNTEIVTIDATAPTLSSATGTKTGQTTASLSVSTNEGNGTLYWVVDTSATPPSAAQVKLGQDNGGAAADDSGSQAVSTTGVQAISGGATGLTAGTGYYAYYMHEDANGNQSSVASSSQFTTDAAEVNLTYLGTNGQTATQAAFTFAGVGLGSEANILIGLHGRFAASTPAITSVKVHIPDVATDPTGTTLSNIVTANQDTAGNRTTVAIYNGARSGGTTGDVVVTFASNAARCAIHRYSKPAHVSVVTGTDLDNTGGISATLNVPADGCAVGISYSGGATSSTPTNLTEDYDGVITGGTFAITAGSNNTATGSTAFTFTWAAADANTVAGAFAAFGPV
jgi:hypothetical protein